MFTYENDIYYLEDPAEDSEPKRITSDGGDDIFNGIVDWIYES